MSLTSNTARRPEYRPDRGRSSRMRSAFLLGLLAMTGTATAAPEPMIDNLIVEAGQITVELDRATSMEPRAYTLVDRDDRRPIRASRVERLRTRVVLVVAAAEPVLAGLLDGLELERFPGGRQSASVIEYGPGERVATLDGAFESALDELDLDLDSAEARSIIVVGNGSLDPAAEPRLPLLKRLAALERVETYALVRPSSDRPFISRVIGRTYVVGDDAELRTATRNAIDRLADRKRVVFEPGDALTWDGEQHALVVGVDGVESLEEWRQLPPLAADCCSPRVAWWWAALAGLGAILVAWVWARRPILVDRRDG